MAPPPLEQPNQPPEQPEQPVEQPNQPVETPTSSKTAQVATKTTQDSPTWNQHGHFDQIFFDLASILNPTSKKNLRFLKVFHRFGVQNGSQIEENLVKMAMLIPSWAVLGGLGCNLGCLG